MANYENLDDLKALLARGIITERQYENCRRLLARKIIRESSRSSGEKSGVIYIVLAFFLGNIGLHNFYAGRYKCGLAQMALTLASFFFCFLTGVVSTLWVLGELLFVNHSANGKPLLGSRGVIWLMRFIALGILASALFIGVPAQE